MEKISSRENPRLKFARRVCERREKNLVFVEGVRLSEEVLRTQTEIHDAFFVDGFGRTSRETELRDAIISLSKSSAIISEKIFNSIADTKTPQGIALICSQPETGRKVIEKRLENDKVPPLILLLHEINNPSNLGAILRTAEAAGVTAIITTRNSADVFSAKSLRGSMGAVFRLPIWNDAVLEDVIDWALSRSIAGIYADSEGALSYLQVNWKVPRLLALGSEGRGLESSEKLLFNESVRIPMKNSVESINIGVACGVILFEALRQRNPIPV